MKQADSSRTNRHAVRLSCRPDLAIGPVLGLLLVLCTLLLPGCRSAQSSTVPPTLTTTMPQVTTQTSATTASPAPTTQSETTTVAATPTPAVPLNPLTGLPLGNPEAQGRRPVAIMINNIKVATPQIGIGSADLIYEMPVEGGITRLMAVFADVAAIPELGSIRSGRHDYIDLAGGLDAIYVHIGASFMANTQFSVQKTDHIDLHVFPAAYWRDPEWKADRGYEHSVKSTGERLAAAISKAGYRTDIRSGQPPAFSFIDPADFAAAEGIAASRVSAPFSSYCVATFDYDPATRLYAKGEFERPQIDLADGQALRFTNVFLLFAHIEQVEDSVLKEIDLTKGSGTYISGGQAQEITWRKGKTDVSFTFLDQSGETLQVNAGKSYIGILSDQRKLTIE